MIIAVRVDDRSRCSLDCICVCVNTLLMVARAAWRVTFRRHCCSLDRKVTISLPCRPRSSGISQDQLNWHRSGRIMIPDHCTSSSASTTRYHDKQICGNQHMARSTPAAGRMRHANTQHNVQNQTGIIGEFAHSALSFSPCRSTRDGRDRVTKEGNGGPKRQSACNKLHEPQDGILIEKAEQAKFNAASVVACGIATCSVYCNLSSWRLCLYSTMVTWDSSVQGSKARVVFRPVLPWQCEKRGL